MIEKVGIDKTKHKSQSDVLPSCRDRRNAKQGLVNTRLIQ
jgi:hypothetical protein